jgi:short-subunit dehydrogenase
MENQKNILVIGASSEIAQAIIKRLVNSNYTILTTTRSGGSATYTLDLEDNGSISSFEIEIDSTPLYCVLYCAGFIKTTETFELFTSEYAKTSERVNFTAAARLLSKLTANVQEDGVIVALSSTAGIWGNPQFPIYASWKAALNTFLLSLHKQVIENKKYVFSICPGPTNTTMRQSTAGDATEHQNPSVIAEYVAGILENPRKYSDSTILVIRDKNLYTLTQDLVQKQ